MVDRLERFNNFKFMRFLFSPFGLDSDVTVVGYVLYEFAAKVTNYSFGFLIPILVADLSDMQYGSGKGRIIWGYTTAIFSVTTVLLYLSCTPLMEFGNWKRRALLGSCLIVSISHVLFIFCFSPPSVILAILLVIVGKTMQRVGDVAFEAFLDIIAIGKDPHEISSRSNIMGYSGMLSFIPFAVPVVAIVYFGFKEHSSVWIQGIVPIVCVGVWYLNFLRYIWAMMSPDIGLGPAMPIEFHRGGAGGVFAMLYSGLLVSIKEHIANVKFIAEGLKDLGLFILAFIFLAGAANTAVSVGAVLAVNVLKINIIYLFIAFLLGVVAAIVGNIFYRYVHSKDWLNPKQILLVNMVILLLSALYVLKVNTFADIIVLAVVAGSQIGAVGAFTRSVLSMLIPADRQSRLFSFYEITQDGTSWVGSLTISSLAVAYGDNFYREIVAYVCVVQFAIGLPILMFVNLTRGLESRQQMESNSASTTTTTADTNSNIAKIVETSIEEMNSPDVVIPLEA
eukprot:gene27853-36698_t